MRVCDLVLLCDCLLTWNIYSLVSLSRIETENTLVFLKSGAISLLSSIPSMSDLITCQLAAPMTPHMRFDSRCFCEQCLAYCLGDFIYIYYFFFGGEGSISVVFLFQSGTEFSWNLTVPWFCSLSSSSPADKGGHCFYPAHLDGWLSEFLFHQNKLQRIGRTSGLPLLPFN